jgi:hypothetical protein
MVKRKSITTKIRKKTRRADVSTKALSNKIEKALLFLTNPRVKEVIERRFGIKSGKPETLESIGQSHSITRERVRQIQDVGLKILRSDEVLSLFDSIFKQLDDLFADHGHLMGEEYLYSTATKTDKAHSLRGKLYLVLTLGEPYQKLINDPRFHAYWMANSSARGKAEKVLDFLITHFNKQNQVFPESEILSLLSKKHPNLPAKMFSVVLYIAKEIGKNNFEEVGLVHWADISPQGVKDKAHLVLKRRGQPLHFTEITELVNKAGFSARPAYSQTVHNELIKDDRFVLTGRGTYGLGEWGYKPGTVEEVIERILDKSKRPMTKDEILEAVLAQRQVKPTTVVLNLQRSPKAQRLRDGRYTLA